MYGPARYASALAIALATLVFTSACSSEKAPAKTSASTTTAAQNDAFTNVEKSMSAAVQRETEPLSGEKICQNLRPVESDQETDSRSPDLHRSIRLAVGPAAETCEPCLRKRIESLEIAELKGKENLSLLWAVVSNTQFRKELRSLAIEKGITSLDEFFQAGVLTLAALYPDLPTNGGPLLRHVKNQLDAALSGTPLQTNKAKGWSLVLFLQAIARESKKPQLAASYGKSDYKRIKELVSKSEPLKAFVRFQ